MKKNTLKSIGAILAGFVLVVILSILTDLIMVSTGLMKDPFDLNTTGFIIFVIGYRSFYGVAGAYLTAALAPDRPLRHAMIGGAISFALTIVGAATMWHLPPHWYPISLIITALPCAWLGGQLFVSRTKPKQP